MQMMISVTLLPATLLPATLLCSSKQFHDPARPYIAYGNQSRSWSWSWSDPCEDDAAGDDAALCDPAL